MQIRNLNGKRICDINENKRLIQIQRKNYTVYIHIDNFEDFKIFYHPKESKKRMYDIRCSEKLIIIQLKDCITHISLNQDMTFNITHKLIH